MSILSQHISHLLWYDGYASVPSIGVFRLVSTGACVGESIIAAPSRRIVFEPMAQADGDALVASVCRREGMDECEARRFVAEQSSAMLSALESGRRIEFPKVGSLYADAATGTLLFAPATFAGVLPALSIDPIASPRVAAPQPAKVEAAASALARRRDEFERLLRRTASSAAAIAMFALVAFVVSQLPTRGSLRQEASIAVPSFESTQPEEPVVALPGNNEPALVLILNTPADGTAPAKQRYKNVVAEDNADAIGRYCLVVASLSSEQEAQTYIKTHSTTDMPLRLLAEDGRWRVFALSGASFDEVNAVARNLDVYSRYPSAWICRR